MRSGHRCDTRSLFLHWRRATSQLHAYHSFSVLPYFGWKYAKTHVRACVRGRKKQKAKAESNRSYHNQRSLRDRKSALWSPHATDASALASCGIYYSSTTGSAHTINIAVQARSRSRCPALQVALRATPSRGMSPPPLSRSRLRTSLRTRSPTKGTPRIWKRRM